MDRFLRLNLSYFGCRTSQALLAVSWLAGLLLGSLISLSADTLLVSTMRAALYGGMSIFGLLTSLLLPFMITAFAVYISQPLLIFGTAFMKAFLFSFTGLGLLSAFGSSAWLIRILLMFADSMILPLLWWVWIRILTDDRSRAARNLFCAAVFAAMIGYFDYAFIAPFLACLI